ncbi:hypothetical protein H9P43_004462 [Blastocladiella emersonii ATCC 22665]|nr:hypothetical protein H9P43_004462 [Blastocladiella emersonii ATCC 22665]
MRPDQPSPLAIATDPAPATALPLPLPRDAAARESSPDSAVGFASAPTTPVRPVESVDQLVVSPACVPTLLFCLRKVLGRHVQQLQSSRPGIAEDLSAASPSSPDSPADVIGGAVAIDSDVYIDAFLKRYLDMARYTESRDKFEGGTSQTIASILDLCATTLAALAPADGDSKKAPPPPSPAHAASLAIVARTLRVFSRSEANCTYLSQRNAVSLLCDAVRGASSPAAVDAVVHLFAALANLALIEPNRAPMLDHGLPALLVSRIATLRGHPTALVELLAALSNLTCYGVDHVQAIVAAKGHLVVQNLIADHVAAAAAGPRELVVHGLHVLAAVSRVDGSRLRDTVDTIVRCIDAHPFEETVLCAALSSLGNFFANDTSPADDRLVQRILAIFTRFAHRKAVLISAFFALSQLLHSEIPSDPIQDALIRALPSFLRMSDEYRWDESFQTTVMFLWSVLARTDRVRRHLLALGIGPRIVHTMLADLPGRRLHLTTSTNLAEDLASATRYGVVTDGDADDDEDADAAAAAGVEDELDDFEFVDDHARDEADGSAGEVDTRPLLRPNSPTSAAQVVVGSQNSAMTRIEMLRMFCAISLMHLGDRPEDQAKLAAQGVLQALYHGVRELQGNNRQILFLHHFVLQRFVKSHDVPMICAFPARPPSLRQLAAFHYTRVARERKAAAALAASATASPTTIAGETAAAAPAEPVPLASQPAWTSSSIDAILQYASTSTSPDSDPDFDLSDANPTPHTSLPACAQCHLAPGTVFALDLRAAARGEVEPSTGLITAMDATMVCPACVPGYREARHPEVKWGELAAGVGRVFMVREGD